mmetsp:Transcript_83392/g.257806  ORF Transcript_83392/g.257806 Transcript_83392/m.257806 type:complete len:274 (-) Transcript_83392:538-1359(-)
MAAKIFEGLTPTRALFRERSLRPVSHWNMLIRPLDIVSSQRKAPSRVPCRSSRSSRSCVFGVLGTSAPASLAGIDFEEADSNNCPEREDLLSSNLADPLLDHGRSELSFGGIPRSEERRPPICDACDEPDDGTRGGLVRPGNTGAPRPPAPTEEPGKEEAKLVPPPKSGISCASTLPNVYLRFSPVCGGDLPSPSLDPGRCICRGDLSSLILRLAARSGRGGVVATRLGDETVRSTLRPPWGRGRNCGDRSASGQPPAVEGLATVEAAESGPW